MKNAPLALYGAGTALSIFGQIRANKAQAQAELQNASWLDEQAEFAGDSANREEDIFKDQVGQLIGQQIGTFASNNVELSGSALDIINDSFGKADSEIQAIRAQGSMNVREANLKARSARRTADRLTDFSTNALQAGGTALTGASNFV